MDCLNYLRLFRWREGTEQLCHLLRQLPFQSICKICITEVSCGKTVSRGNKNIPRISRIVLAKSVTTTLASQTLTMVSASRWMFQRFDAWLKQAGISSHGILMNWKASWKGKLANRKGDEAFWKDVIFIHFPMMFLNRASGPTL